MADRNLAIRLAVIDGGKVKAELRDVGDSGARALQRIEEASRPASRALQALDGVAGEVRGGLEEMAGRAGPLGAGLMRLGGLAGFDQRADQLLLGIGERDADPAQCGEAVDRILQRLAQLRGGTGEILAEHRAHVLRQA